MSLNQADREHHQKSCNLFDALIGGASPARPVKRNEFKDIQAAMDAYWKEWKNLKSREV